MNKIKWILQSDFHCKYVNKIESLLQEKGIEYLSGQYYDEMFYQGVLDMVGFFYGSINFCKRMHKLPIYPEVFNLKDLKCSNYYPRISNSLFNNYNVFVTYEQFNQNREWLIDRIGDGRDIFVRPDDNDKLFTGLVADVSTDLQRLTCETIESNQLLVLSAPKNIHEEYRLVYVDGKFVTGSQYQKNRQLFEKEIFDTDTLVKDTNKIASKLPKFCVVDIAVGDYGWGVLEIGAINCAGFYRCNIEKIVDAINGYLEENNDLY